MIAKSGCMDCGSPVAFEEFSPVAACPSCGTAHRLPRDSSGAWLLTYSSELRMEDARQRALEIVKPKLGKSRRNKLEIIETFPVYLPVWKFTCRAAGWFRSSDGELLPLNLKKEVRLPAYENTSSIGTPKEISGSDARISPESEFPMLHVKISQAGLNKEAEGIMAGEISSIGDVPEAGRMLSVSFEEPILALYPAWIVRFKTRNGEHSLTIDGVTGQSMNVVDIPVTDEKLVTEAALATISGSILSAGIALSFVEGFHGVELGLVAAGAALFTIANLLRMALRSSKVAPKPKVRRVSA